MDIVDTSSHRWRRSIQTFYSGFDAACTWLFSVAFCLLSSTLPTCAWDFKTLPPCPIELHRTVQGHRDRTILQTRNKRKRKTRKECKEGKREKKREVCTRLYRFHSTFFWGCRARPAWGPNSVASSSSSSSNGGVDISRSLFFCLPATLFL